LLLKNGADIHKRAANRGTTLIRAASAGYKETVKLLLNKGVSLQPSTRGATALFAAAAFRHTDTVWLLLDCSADAN